MHLWFGSYLDGVSNQRSVPKHSEDRRQYLLTLAIPIIEAASDAAGAMFEASVED